MEDTVKTYKRKLHRELRHIKLILARKRHHLPAVDWRRLVQETKDSILNAPQEFFCQDIPPGQTFSEAIEKVFDGFMEDQRLLANQSRKTLEIFFNTNKKVRGK